MVFSFKHSLSFSNLQEIILCFSVSDEIVFLPLAFGDQIGQSEITVKLSLIKYDTINKGKCLCMNS